MAAPSSKTRIYLLYIVGFLDLLGVSMTIPMMSIYAREMGASPKLIGILGSTYGFLQLFSSPIVGDWSDRAGRRAVLVYTLLLCTLGYLMLASATSVTMLFISRIPPGLFKHSQEVAVSYLGTTVARSQHALVLGRFHAASSVGFIVGPIVGGHLADLPGGFRLVAMGTTIIFLVNAGIFKHTQGLVKAALSDHVLKEDQAAAFGRYNAISTLGFVVGPVIGGHLADLPHGRTLVIYITAALFALNAAIAWWFIPVDVPISSDEAKEKSLSLSSSLKIGLFIENLRQIDWPRLWDIFIVRFLLGFASMVFRSTFSLSLDARFQLSPKEIGYIISYVSVISTVSGFLVGRIARWYRSDRRLLLHIGLLQALSIALSTAAPSVTMLVLAMAPLSVANAVARVCITNLTIERVRGDETGAVLGCGASVLSIARMMSPMLGGLVWEIHAAGPGVLGMSSALMAVVLLGTMGQPFTKHQKIS